MNEIVTIRGYAGKEVKGYVRARGASRAATVCVTFLLIWQNKLV
jgi:hypothetical protein